MNIAILLPDAKLGGAQKVLINLSREFEKDHRVQFILLSQSGDLLATLPNNIPVLVLTKKNQLGLFAVIQAFISLLRYMRKNSDTRFLSTGTGMNLLACTARLFAPKCVSLVIREACSSKNSNSHFIALLKRFLYPCANGMIGVSDGVAVELKALASKHQIVVSIPNPVDVERLQALADKKDELLSAFPHPYLLTVGRLVPQKNTALLIDAYAKIEAEIGLHLVIIGAGPLEVELRQRIAQHGLASKIHLLGEIINPYPWYKYASMFALSSDWEGYPNVLLEALVYGLPVVSTDCEFGPAQILDNNRYGQLVQIGDVDAMANAIRATLKRAKVFDKWDATRFNAPATATHYLVFMESCSHG